MGTQYKMIGGDGREYGPATLEELRQWCEEGRLSHGTPVWRSDEARWRPAGGWDELKWDLQTPAVPAPASDAPAPPLPAAALVAAGFWVRVAAYLVDWVVLTTITGLVTLPWAEPLARLQAEFFAQWKSATPDSQVMIRYLLVSLAIHLPLGLAYFAGFHGALGATPGKQILGLRVVREDGSALGFPRACLRYAAALLSSASFGIGYLLAAIPPEKRALHDVLARTRVVRVR